MTSEPNQRRRDKDFLLKMSIKEKRNWANSIVLRLMEAWQVEQMQDIAQFVGGHLRMPSAWIQKGLVPWEVVYTCHLETGCSIDWLYNGSMPVLERTPALESRFQTISRDTLQVSGNQFNLIKQTQPNGLNGVAKAITAALVQQYSSVLPK